MNNGKNILIICCFFLITFYFPNQLTAQDQTKTIRWLKTASDTEKLKFWSQLSSELNKFYPMNVDSETLIFSASPQKDGIIFNYKTINYQYSDRSKKEWDDLTKRIGFRLDLDDPYITFQNDYIETVWWILKNFYDRNLIYKGFKILPYCPRCETPLSSH